MRVIRHLNNIKNIEPCALTIGNFDGVHLGHQKIINKTIQKAKENNLKSAILTFSPHPINFFKSRLARNFLIQSLSQKLNFFKKNQIDYVFILPFNENFAQINAADFIEKILVQKMRTKELIIGYDFIFGKNRQGNFDLLKQERSFNSTQIEACKNEDIIYSSTKIRDFLKQGKINLANQILGKKFEISGVVINGKKLANKIGFPTANMIAKPHIIEPKFGVYKSKTYIPFLDKSFKSVTNFGVKPTFEGEQTPLFETHIFDFNEEKYGSLYGKKTKISLIDFIREEKKFSSIQELKKQIAIDAKKANS